MPKKQFELRKKKDKDGNVIAVEMIEVKKKKEEISEEE